jgi:hypothetical protein
MSATLKRMLSLLLAVAMVSMPLSGLAVAPMTQDQDMDHCASANPDNGHPGPVCKHCDDGSCTEPGCSSCHISVLGLSAFTITVVRQPHHLLASVKTDLLSRTDPPPLRPPL